MVDNATLKAAYSTLLVWTNSLVLVEAALGLLFVIWFWKRPIMVLSQRGFLLAVPILLGVGAGAYFVGSSTTQECWVHYLMFQISFQMFFAALTAREYRVWAMYRNIQKGEA